MDITLNQITFMNVKDLKKKELKENIDVLEFPSHVGSGQRVAESGLGTSNLTRSGLGEVDPAFCLQIRPVGDEDGAGLGEIEMDLC